MKILYLIRGLPGSGKTTLAKSICNVVFSADDYFTDKKRRGITMGKLSPIILNITKRIRC